MPFQSQNNNHRFKWKCRQTWSILLSKVVSTELNHALYIVCVQTIYIYICPHGVTVIIIENEHGELSSIPGWSGLHLT